MDYQMDKNWLGDYVLHSMISITKPGYEWHSSGVNTGAKNLN